VSRIRRYEAFSERPLGKLEYIGEEFLAFIQGTCCQKFLSQPLREFAEGPCGFAEGPREFAEGPREFAEGPREFAGGSREFAGSLCDVALIARIDAGTRLTPAFIGLWSTFGSIWNFGKGGWREIAQSRLRSGEPSVDGSLFCKTPGCHL
jgi:hypothetical protein